MADKDSPVRITQTPQSYKEPLPESTRPKVPTFIERFLNNPHVHTLMRDLERSGDLIYRPRDILETSHPLAKLLRMMFVDQRITTKYFEDMHHRFCVSQGFDNESINSDRNNTRKSLNKPEPTFSFFEKVHAIFNARIIDMSATLHLHNGEIVTYQRHKNFLHPSIKTICVDDVKNMEEVTVGTPIFLAKDIEKTTHPIALFIHMYVVHQKITIEEFYYIFNHYFEKLGYTPNRINAHRNNSVRQYFIPTPTFKAWEKFNSVMGNTLLDLATVIAHKDGTIARYAISESQQMAMTPIGDDSMCEE